MIFSSDYLLREIKIKKVHVFVKNEKRHGPFLDLFN